MNDAAEMTKAPIHETLRIGGEKPDRDERIEVFNPWDNSVVGTVPCATRERRQGRPRARQHVQLLHARQPRVVLSIDRGHAAQSDDRIADRRRREDAGGPPDEERFMAH